MQESQRMWGGEGELGEREGETERGEEDIR